MKTIFLFLKRNMTSFFGMMLGLTAGDLIKHYTARK